MSWLSIPSARLIAPIAQTLPSRRSSSLRVQLLGVAISVRAFTRTSFGVKSATSILLCLRVANRLIHHHKKVVAYLDAAIGADENLVAASPWKLDARGRPDLDD